MRSLLEVCRPCSNRSVECSFIWPVKMRNQTEYPVTDTTTGMSIVSNTTALPAVLHASYNTKTILLLVSLCLIMLIGIVGNSLVCYYFGWKIRGGRTIPDQLFLYLGVVDLLSSIINPATYIYFELTRYKRWDFGVVGCKVLVPFGPISTLMSALLIQIITVDRYLVIVNPLGRTHGRGCINVSVLVAFALSVACNCSYIMMLQVVPGKTCIVEDVSDKSYSIPAVTFLLLQDITFISVIVFTNTAISLRLTRKDALSTSETGLQQSIIRRQKLFRLLLTMAVIFLVLVLPRDLLQLSYTFSWMGRLGIKYDYSLVQLNTVLKILYTSNSCANVFIYSKMHSKFRGSLRLFICRKAVAKNRPSAMEQANTKELIRLKAPTHEVASVPSLSTILLSNNC